MHLTRGTDYALRLLIHLAQAGGQRLSIAEVADAQAISRTYLMRITLTLVKKGFVSATRGHGGGIELARPAAEINLGAVVRAMEPRTGLVDCTDCKLIRCCRLPGALQKAQQAFYASLDTQSLADIIK